MRHTRNPSANRKSAPSQVSSLQSTPINSLSELVRTPACDNKKENIEETQPSAFTHHSESDTSNNTNTNKIRIKHLR